MLASVMMALHNWMLQYSIDYSPAPLLISQLCCDGKSLLLSNHIIPRSRRVLPDSLYLWSGNEIPKYCTVSRRFLAFSSLPTYVLVYLMQKHSGLQFWVKGPREDNLDRRSSTESHSLSMTPCQAEPHNHKYLHSNHGTLSVPHKEIQSPDVRSL